MKVPSGDVGHADLDNLNALLKNLKADSSAMSSATDDNDHVIGTHKSSGEEVHNHFRYGASIMEHSSVGAASRAEMGAEAQRSTEVETAVTEEEARPREPIWCGGHGSPSCAHCPEQKGEVWCNGDCEWVYGDCAFRSDLVWCGGHSAQACDECVHLLLKDAGQGWCNGECSWNEGAKTCHPMQRLPNTGWATEGNPKWWLEDVTANTTGANKPGAPMHAAPVKAVENAPAKATAPDSMTQVQKYITEWAPSDQHHSASIQSSLLAESQFSTVVTTTPAPRSLETTVSTTTAIPRPA
jgi:hypothetical protein